MDALHRPMRAAIYTRVSTTDQNSDLQLREIREYADRQGWQIADTYQDIASGAKASRPGLNRLMADAMVRKFDTILVWKLDRFGRSLVDCLNNIRILEDSGGSQNQAARRLGIARDTLRRRLIALGLHPTRRNEAGEDNPD